TTAAGAAAAGPTQRRNGGWIVSTAAPEPRVTAIIVNYHQPGLTRAAIDSVLASEGVAAEVIVVENEGSGDWVRAEFPAESRIRVIANPTNRGFGAACNQGFELALAGNAAFV